MDVFTNKQKDAGGPYLKKKHTHTRARGKKKEKLETRHPLSYHTVDKLSRRKTVRFCFLIFLRKLDLMLHANCSKAVVPGLVVLFVALWCILRGDLFCVLPCVILFLCFSVLLALRLPRLGKRELILVFRTFARFMLIWFCRFPLPLCVWEGLRFVIVAFPGLFSYPFKSSKKTICRKCQIIFFYEKKKIIIK